MRFFLFELVPCCGSSERPGAPANPPRRKETSALVPLSCAAPAPNTCPSEKQRRSRRGSLAWRPSLVAISEESVASVGPTRAGDRTVGPGKGSAGKDRSMAKIRVWDDRDRFG